MGETADAQGRDARIVSQDDGVIEEGRLPDSEGLPPAGRGDGGQGCGMDAPFFFKAADELEVFHDGKVRIPSDFPEPLGREKDGLIPIRHLPVSGNEYWLLSGSGAEKEEGASI